jgi:hypothetical protein
VARDGGQDEQGISNDDFLPSTFIIPYSIFYGSKELTGSLPCKPRLLGREAKRLPAIR